VKKINDIEDVARWRLCTGCGACVPACPEHAVALVDIEDRGIRPVINSDGCAHCGTCVKVCPGIEILHEPFNNQTIPELRQAWGPILEIWEGYASDSEIRYNASSGGIATALALYCLEKRQAAGVLHIGTKPGAPLENVPVFSKSRGELLTFTGSRYSPATPCEKLNWLEGIDRPCVFIGKPCDVVALRKTQLLNPVLALENILSISIFCAGTPSSRGTKVLLDKLNVKLQDVEELRYRGCGWPGDATVRMKGTEGRQRQMSYEQSWGEILSRHVPLRCRLCPDGTGEFADISCGDPWYKSPKPEDPGQSQVLVRTEKGRKVLNEAMKAGYIKLKQVNASTLPLSQKGLLGRKRHIWARLMAMRLTGIAVPRYEGFNLFANWCELPVKEKICSLLGTFKRIIFRGWFRSVKYEGRRLAGDKDDSLMVTSAQNQIEDD
jgi:coenzyme F420 hydrogenase subunit beta